ncbi:MAG: HEAT repeat domain-containing protein, partial [Planctomycetia bacterium]|nr:HEAT repeat domain-containing protein [Planctomycetia bacterium]
VRATAARSLGIVGVDKESITALTAALRDQDPLVVVASADALQRFKSEAKAAVPTLVELWKGKNNDIRGAAGAALNHIDREAAREAGVPQP